MFFLDFSQELQKKRKTFNDVRRRLRERNLKYSLLYSSRLRVQHKGTVKFFDTPDKVDTWLSGLR